MFKFCSMLLLLLSTGDLSFAEVRNSPDTHFEAREFLRELESVKRNEPYLYHSEKHASMQAWTRHYQRFNDQFGVLKLALVNPAMANEDFYLQNYEKLALHATKLWSELPYHLRLHSIMNHKKSNRLEWLNKVKSVADTLLIENKTPYRQHNCDFVTPPLNALWFMLNARSILHQLGQHHFKDSWVENVKIIDDSYDFLPNEKYQEQLISFSAELLAEIEHN